MAAGFTLIINGTRIRTSEALYQACRFPHRPDIQRLIIEQDSPMTAKMKSKPHRFDSRLDWEYVRVAVMKWCLRVKLAQNWSKFGDLLLSTGTRSIVEESRKDDFWGAKPTDGEILYGQNVLGRLLMELREKLRSDPESLRTVQPLPIKDFLLFGQDILPLLSDEPHQNEQPPLLMPAASPDRGPTVTAQDEVVEERLTNMQGQPPRKLIEVALPLDAINEGSKPETENPFLKGHPRAIHNWWARTPLSICRAVLFAQLADDPGNGLDSVEAEKARKPLLDLVQRLGTWDATTDEELIEEARKIIDRQFDGRPPAVWDMFAGRGSISIEAQRLGLRVYSSDLNPVAVTIQKALLQYPQQFAGWPPVNPQSQRERARGAHWHGNGAEGLIADIAAYGEWIRQQAYYRIGHLYPEAQQPGGKRFPVSAWLWARTIKCPNPACGAQMPLVRSFSLSSKTMGGVWIEPILDQSSTPPIARFEIRHGKGKAKRGTKERSRSRCLFCGTDNISDAILREQATRYGINVQLMAVVAEGSRTRVYLPPVSVDVVHITTPDAEWLEQPLPDNARWFSPPMYGLSTYRALFSPRQLTALMTFSDLIGEARDHVLADARSASSDDNQAQLYANAIATYLGCALSRMTDYHCALATWNPTNENVSHLFQRQAIPMAWDFAEANPLQGKLDFSVASKWVADSLSSVPALREPAKVFQFDARQNNPPITERVSISTDPPYYDNIGYADLSDFFYVWLRRALRQVDPETFRTVLTPKSPELIASPSRHNGSSAAAEAHFREGFAAAFISIQRVADQSVPMAVYYAFKQSETDTDDEGNGATASTGWETMLEGLINAGFAITGTWPVRTTKKARSIARNTNALASAIVIVCRERPLAASVVSRREFANALKRELPEGVRILQHENIAPVDLAQAAIGPGMAVFSRYAQVLEADGSPMSVRSALVEINRVLDETLAEQEGDLDADTRFCIAWFEQYGTTERSYGEAEVLFTAKNTSFEGLQRAGIIAGGRGKVRLKTRNEMDASWDPRKDQRVTDWECVQHLVRAMTAEAHGGVTEAARLVIAMGLERAENARALAYRLYTVSERKRWTEDALAYNILATSWPQIQSEVARAATGGSTQTELAI
jgi:putative DNA methylase